MGIARGSYLDRPQAHHAPHVARCRSLPQSADCRTFGPYRRIPTRSACARVVPTKPTSLKVRPQPWTASPELISTQLCPSLPGSRCLRHHLRRPSDAVDRFEDIRPGLPAQPHPRRDVWRTRAPPVGDDFFGMTARESYEISPPVRPCSGTLPGTSARVCCEHGSLPVPVRHLCPDRDHRRRHGRRRRRLPRDDCNGTIGYAGPTRQYLVRSARRGRHHDDPRDIHTISPA